jgi:hypothetical protein
MVDSVFDSLMIHTCSVIQASVSSDALNQETISWTGGTTTTGVPCRLVPSVKRELSTGAVISDYELYLSTDAAPATLLVAGVEDTHRIAAVVGRNNGVSVHAGPFDIRGIIDETGEGHHLLLRLLSVG